MRKMHANLNCLLRSPKNVLHSFECTFHIHAQEKRSCDQGKPMPSSYQFLDCSISERVKFANNNYLVSCTLLKKEGLSTAIQMYMHDPPVGHVTVLLICNSLYTSAGNAGRVPIATAIKKPILVEAVTQFTLCPITPHVILQSRWTPVPKERSVNMYAYRGTSDKRQSEIGTTSFQTTLFQCCQPICNCLEQDVIFARNAWKLGFQHGKHLTCLLLVDAKLCTHDARANRARRHGSTTPLAIYVDFSCPLNAKLSLNNRGHRNYFLTYKNVRGCVNRHKCVSFNAQCVMVGRTAFSTQC